MHAAVLPLLLASATSSVLAAPFPLVGRNEPFPSPSLPPASGPVPSAAPATANFTRDGPADASVRLPSNLTAAYAVLPFEGCPSGNVSNGSFVLDRASYLNGTLLPSNTTTSTSPASSNTNITITLSWSNSSGLETYGAFQARYNAWACAGQEGSPFFASCCYPLSVNGTLDSLPVGCNATVNDYADVNVSAPVSASLARLDLANVSLAATPLFNTTTNTTTTLPVAAQLNLTNVVGASAWWSNTSALESYASFAQRYIDSDCATVAAATDSDSTDFFAQCCYPLSANATVQALPELCLPVSEEDGDCDAYESDADDAASYEAGQQSTEDAPDASTYVAPVQQQTTSTDASSSYDLPSTTQASSSSSLEQTTETYVAPVMQTSDVVVQQSTETTDASPAQQATTYVAPAAPAAETPITTTSSAEQWTQPETVAATTAAAAAQAPVVAQAETQSSQTFVGSASYYWQNGKPGNCGSYASDSDKVCALRTSVYADGAHCGQMVTIRRPDTGAATSCRVADSCPTCVSDAHIDLSYGAFIDIATQEEGMVNVEWYFQ